jgi:hypothetical protein
MDIDQVIRNDSIKCFNVTLLDGLKPLRFQVTNLLISTSVYLRLSRCQPSKRNRDNNDAFHASFFDSFLAPSFSELGGTLTCS